VEKQGEMSVQPNEISFQPPRGYEIRGEVLQEFERGLDLLNPQASRVPCHVLGYGEISTVFEIQAHGLEGLAFKRMGCFETLDELRPYVETYLAYNRVLEEEVGLHLPAYGYALFVCDTGRPVFYIIQQRLQPGSIGSSLLRRLSPSEVTVLFQAVLQEMDKVWSYNQSHPDCQVGIDGQISNWAVVDYVPGQPGLGGGDGLLYIDTSTPLMRLNGVEQLDPELFLRSAPPYLVWVLRLLFVSDVMTRYYDPRKVTLDLLGNLYKEQRPELIPDLVAETNTTFSSQAGYCGLAPITEKEVRAYYKEDEVIWSLYLSFRRFDRYLRVNVLHRPYPYILPGKIKR
jgi:hypothetical protein